MEYHDDAEPRLVELPKILDPRGNLSFIEGGKYLPFEIERVYWIYDVPGDKLRHGRALRHTAEMIVALSGAFDVVLERHDGEPQRFHLNRGYRGLVVPPMTWRVIDNFSTNSVAMVLASTTYDEADYIRDYEQFKSQADV
jgi:oxalate decarboxylase/phosphoglucose isomerase-like protein (cupin superfamily)